MSIARSVPSSARPRSAREPSARVLEHLGRARRRTHRHPETRLGTRLDVHFHTLDLDGVDARSTAGELVFRPLGEPTAEDLEKRAQRTAERARTIYVNLEPMRTANPYFSEVHLGRAEEVLPELFVLDR